MGHHLAPGIRNVLGAQSHTNPLKPLGRRRRPPVVRYNVLQLLTYASLAVSSLVMPLFARDLGADTATIGLIGAGYGLASFLSNAVFGRAGDRLDRRSLLLFGFLAGGAASVVQYFADTPASLLAARFLFGLASGMIPPTLAAYVYDVNRPLGKFTSYNAFGWLLASGLVIGAGYLGAHAPSGPFGPLRDALEAMGPIRSLFLAGAAFCLIAFLVALPLRPMRLGLDVPLFPVGVIARNLHVYLSVFIRHFGAAAIWVIYPLYILELGGDLALVGWVHIVNMVSQILVYRNVERIRHLGTARSLIAAGLILSGLTFWSFTLAENAYQLLPLQVPLGVSFACLWLGSMKEVMERNVERATATGLLNASMNLSNVAGPLAGGLIAAAIGFRATMWFAAAMTALAFALFLLLGRARAAREAVPLSAAPGPAGEVAP